MRFYLLKSIINYINIIVFIYAGLKDSNI